MSLARLIEALEATWPPAELAVADGWVLRRGAGGGKRVSAASPGGGMGSPADPAAAEAAMRAWDQPLLFRLLPGEETLDETLAARGYETIDPTVFYTAPVAALDDGRDETAKVIRVSAPLAVVDEIWVAGGIGPARRAVMSRARGPKIELLARIGDRPAGVAFVALDGEIAMVHAIEVAPQHRRKGAGEQLLRGAASFAAEHGASTLALAVTRANTAAGALYQKLGMSRAGGYHYRIKPG